MGGSGDPKVPGYPKVPGDPGDHGIVPILPLDKIRAACYNIPEAHRKAPPSRSSAPSSGRRLCRPSASEAAVQPPLHLRPTRLLRPFPPDARTVWITGMAVLRHRLPPVG